MPTSAMAATVAALWLVAVVIPGPNFFAVARMAAARSRGEALVTVSALGVGSTCWGLAGFFGVHAVFAWAPLFYSGLKLVGAGYLAFVGVRIVLGSFRPVADDGRADGAAAFRLELLTSLSNPKSALLVGSLFTAVMPPDAPVSVGLWTVAEMVAISLGWYSLLACVISAAPVARLFRRFRAWIDRAAGVIFVAFAGRLVVTTLLEGS